MPQTLQQNQMNAYGYLPPNLLVNPGFEIWQRGAGAFTLSGSYSADEWQIGFGGGESMSVTRNSSPKVGSYCAQAVSVGTTVLAQGIEAYKSLEGLCLTFSAWVKTSTASAVRLWIRDYNGSTTAVGESSLHSGGGDWERLTAVKLVRSGLQYDGVNILGRFGLEAALRFEANATAYIDGASLVVGNFPEGIPFAPPNPAEDQQRCERFYEVHGGTYQTPYMRGYGAAAGYLGVSVPFATRKYATPTVTKTGTWTVFNCAQPIANNPSPFDYNISALVTANGDTYWLANAATALVTAEVS